MQIMNTQNEIHQRSRERERVPWGPPHLSRFSLQLIDWLLRLSLSLSGPALSRSPPLFSSHSNLPDFHSSAFSLQLV